MKLILFSFLILLMLACDQSPVEPDFVPMTEEEILKQQQRFEKKRMKNSLKRKNETKAIITKQSNRRKFLEDVKDLEQTDEKKIEFFLSKARKSLEYMDVLSAKKYAKKVLELDPKNREARKILNKSSRLARTFNVDGSRNAEIKKQEKEQKELMSVFKKAKNNDLYKGSAKRKAEAYLNKQTHTLEMKNGQIRMKKR